MSDRPDPQQPQHPAPPPQNPYYPQGQPQQPAPPPYGQPPYQQPGQQAPYPYAARLPDHPSANTAMVLGIVALAGMATCAGITLVLSPFAWVIGGRAVKEIDANPTRYGGRGPAQAGRVMGIIGTILLVLAVLLFALIISIAVAPVIGSAPSIHSAHA